MKLKDYLTKHPANKAALCRKWEVDYTTLWRWIEGKAVPSAANIAKIKEWSNGSVTADDFYN